MDASSGNSSSDVQRLIDWLDASPPYEAVGRVIVEAAHLELGLLQLCLNNGLDRDKALKMKVRHLVTYLKRETGIDHGLLDRCQPAVENRHLLAHGSWLNLLCKGQAFVKPDRDKPGFLGKLVTVEDLTEWGRELSELATRVQAMGMHKP